MRLFQTSALLVAIAGAQISAPSFAGLKPLKPGQYNIGQIQHICLKGDGTWYGTTFNFGGHWVSSIFTPVATPAAMYGNYTVQGLHANDTITVLKLKGGDLGVVWYDWYDNFSYEKVLLDQRILFEKKSCDPPFQGENTHAATE
jgi:hypothetical protein